MVTCPELRFRKLWQAAAAELICMAAITETTHEQLAFQSFQQAKTEKPRLR